MKRGLYIFFFLLPFLANAKGSASFAFGEKGTVLIFVASHCPCTDSHRHLVQTLVRNHQEKGVRFYAIFSNKEETEELAARFMRQTGWTFPWLIDRDGKIKERFDAKITPEAILMNGKAEVVYRGAIDDSVLNVGRVEHPYLQTALLQLLAGDKITPASTPPYGCYIVR